MSPKIGIVGARRARQGLGPYVARDFAALGADVVGYTATTQATLEEAERQLAQWGIQANGYTRLEDLLAGEKLDAVAILTPAAAHTSGLEHALAAGLHVLCEKPLIWGGVPAANQIAAERLIDGFESRSLLLFENCQWPRTLASYYELFPFPGGAARTPGQFAMSLCPASAGLQILGDALPHPLSMLLELSPDPNARAENVSLQIHNPEQDHLSLSFDYVAAASTIRVELEFRSQMEPGPRPASYALDGNRAERRIREPEYQMELVDGSRSVDLPDPLRAQIALFLDELSSFGASGGSLAWELLRARQRLLASICEVCRPELDD